MAELASLPNPFLDNVVQDAWQAPADVVDIHRDVFDACLAGIESAAKGVQDSLVIYGPAGSGKTHLLTRLQRHLHETAKSAPDQVLRCVFVFVRLQSSSQMLWQHVRRKLARDLMRNEEGLTQLQRLVAHQIAERAGTSPRLETRRLRVLGKEDHDTVAATLADLATALDVPRELCVVLEHLLCNRAVRDAAAWLSGESLPERVLAQLDLGPDEEEDREEAARGVVTALARLAGKTLPIVFCFDQVEALQRGQDDQDAFYRFGRLAADLHDADRNVFLITCLQSARLLNFNQAVAASDLDRLAKRRRILNELTPAQVDALVRARLDSMTELTELRSSRSYDPFYPLTRDFVAGLSKEGPCVPRRVLTRCAREFEQLQHGHALHRPDASEFLGGQWEERARYGQQSLSPARTTDILVKGAEVLSAVGEFEVSEQDKEGADLVMAGKNRVAVSLRNEADGRSLRPKLQSLLKRIERKDGAQLRIVRDPRLSIAPTATKTREALTLLIARGARVVEPTLEALAALEALSSLLADAKSGDLANDGEALSQGEVLKWLRSLRDDLRLEPVRELIEELTSAVVDDPSVIDEQDLGALLARERAIPLDVASKELGRDADRLLQVARKHDSRFLILDGPPVVLLDRAGITAEVGA